MGVEEEIKKLKKQQDEIVKQLLAGGQKGQSQYAQALSQFGFRSTNLVGPLRSGYVPVSSTGFRYNKEGNAVQYDTGVMVDLEAGPTPQAIYMDHSDANVEGSAAYMAKVRNEWTVEQVNEWRKKLGALGYQVAEKGGVDTGFLQALQEYHFSRYLNLGDEVPAAAAEGVTEQLPPEELLAARVEQMWNELGLGDPSEEERKIGVRHFQATLRSQLKRGMPAETAGAVAEERYTQQLRTDPQVAPVINRIRRNTQLRDTLSAAAEATSTEFAGSLDDQFLA